MEQNTKQGKNKEFLENQFPKGQSGNPNGRPKGSLSFTTLYKKAIENIAKSKGVTPEDFEVELVMQAITKGFNGDRSFYADTMDRVHGKAIQFTENNSTIEHKLDPELQKTINNALDEII
jgi:predicted outer membrane protein